MIKKKSETVEQFNERLLAELKRVKQELVEQQEINGDAQITSPQSGNPVAQEAEGMFNVIAYFNLLKLQGKLTTEVVAGMVEEQLYALGFDAVEIATNKCFENNPFTKK